MNDATLITQILKGNQHAFTRLVEKHQKLVFHMIVRMIKQEEDVEDVCQEVFIKVFKNLKHFRGDAKLSTWIAKIAYNVGLNHLRKHDKALLVMSDDFLAYNQVAIDRLPDKILENDELKSLIFKEINDLPILYRTVATLYYLEELSYSEIAEITAIKQTTLRSYISRTRAILKQKLIFVLKDEN